MPQLKRLGRELKISPKSIVEVGDQVSLVINIGDHKAALTMSNEAFLEFNDGALVRIETAKDFKNMLYKY